jgi:hypothetical protein
MFDILEALKIGGSISGLLAGGFLIWDRFTKHYPVATIVARPLAPHSRNIVLFFRLKNFSDRPILVSWENRSEANRLRIGRDQSTSGIVDAMSEDEIVVALGPEAEVSLPLIRPGNYADIDRGNTLEIDLCWRFAQPRIWKADRKISVWIRKRDLDYMVDHYMPPTDTSATED